ncbi:hypothetical protein NDU88_006744 [Pleurodeles waltl]|uniref:Uncharacterized protein n=1 Tax=Pleurodeles waltl TaxID=8319 RepID=A0AAV7UNF0_PLEWA|nr:hypothetical protein NDU88_006744 [Pleurodeles waltl]
MGFAPAGIAIPRVQRPGTSGIQQESQESASGAAGCGGRRQCWLTVGAHGQGAWVEDEEQDWEESIIEEGELVEDWEEEEWWVSSRGGRAPLLILLISHFRKRSSRGCSVGWLGSRLEEQKAQERPMLLSPGKELARQGNMVSVAIEAKKGAEGAAHLVKGVYVIDVGVTTEGGAAGPGKGDSTGVHQGTQRIGTTSR